MTIVLLHRIDRPVVLRLVRVTAIIAVFGLPTCGASQSQDDAQVPIDAAQVDRATMLMTGVWNAIEKIRIFDVRIVETIVSAQGTEQFEYRYAVDKERDWLRYDRQAPNRLTQYARNDSEVLWHAMQSGQVQRITRYPRDYIVKVYDARPYGFLIAPLFASGAYHGKIPEDLLRQMHSRRMEHPFVDWHETERYLDFTVEYDMKQFPDRRGRTRIVLDHQQGNMPTLVAQSGGLRPVSEWAIDNTTETEWKQLGEVWVPVSCRLTNQDLNQKWHLAYEWYRVNESLPEELFTAEGFDAPQGTLVMNNKFGTGPILEEIVGEEPVLSLVPPPSSSSQVRVWMIAINVAIIAIAGTAWLMRWRMKRSWE